MNKLKTRKRDTIIILKYVRYGRYQVTIRSSSGDLVLGAMKVDEMRVSVTGDEIPIEFVLKMSYKEFTEKQLSKLLKEK